jgi:hypothetical protein
MRQSRNNFLLPPDALFALDRAQFGFQQFTFSQISETGSRGTSRTSFGPASIG